MEQQASLLSLLQRLTSRLSTTPSFDLSMIVCERNDSLNHVTIESFKIKNISKTGNVITIQSKAKLSKNLLGIKNTDITMVFTEGVSDSKAVNILFSDLIYIKE